MDNNKMLEYTDLFKTAEFEANYTYTGNDLGAVWTKEATRFRVWAPTAVQIVLSLYKTGDNMDIYQCIPMVKDVCGTWVTALAGDYHGVYYDYAVVMDGEIHQAVDPYAKAVGVNGERGMIVDLESTNPEGFQGEEKPPFVNSTDAVLYELHIRDFSADPSSGMLNRGKYLAFTETDTQNSHGDSTGVKYLKELGITHIHLLPAFDYASIDEAKLSEEKFNWGYDPKNFNVPEGSYSTDPYHGEVRI
ncbi:MAG: type I pullulanase, partial [Mobilitalea sp.]